MFMSDAQKQFSRLYESVGRVNALKWRLKNETLTNAQRAELETELKAAKKTLRKTVTGITMSGTIIALITLGMRWLLNKPDKEKSFVEQFTGDFASQLAGMFPFLRDIESKLVDGYDINNYAVGMLNDGTESIKGLWDSAGKVIAGTADRNDAPKALRSFLYSVGQFTGLPTRNLYNDIYGLISQFSPSTAYEMNSLFAGTAKYKADALKAYADGQKDLAKTIMSIGIGDKLKGISNTVLNEIVRLELNEINATPKAVGSSITYDGVTYNLTGGQQTQFNRIHSGAVAVAEKMLISKEYIALDDEGKSKAINAVYNYYYNLGIEDLLGVDIETKAQLFGTAIPIEKLAPIIVYCQSLESETDKSGKTISGSLKSKITKYIQTLKLTAVQKYMIMGYLGYSNTNGSTAVKAYIQSLKLTKAEKEYLYTASGYTLTTKKAA
jgi:hypothetical protein